MRILSVLSAFAVTSSLSAHATHSILRFDGQTGAPKGNFVARGTADLAGAPNLQVVCGRKR